MEGRGSAGYNRVEFNGVFAGPIDPRACPMGTLRSLLRLTELIGPTDCCVRRATLWLYADRRLHLLSAAFIICGARLCDLD